MPYRLVSSGRGWERGEGQQEGKRRGDKGEGGRMGKENEKGRGEEGRGERIWDRGSRRKEREQRDM